MNVAMGVIAGVITLSIYVSAVLQGSGVAAVVDQLTWILGLGIVGMVTGTAVSAIF